jgi:hypothetical protein
VTNQIQIESAKGDVALTVTTRQNEKGECRFVVGDEELAQWQLLKRVLEPLFFPPEK